MVEFEKFADIVNNVAEENNFKTETLYTSESIAKVAEREKILREIMLYSVSDLEYEEIIKSIVTKTGILFKADRCFFVKFDLVNDNILPINDYAEYLSSKKIRSHITRQPTRAEIKTLLEITKQKKAVFVNDTRKTDLLDPSRQMLIEDLSVKSHFVIPAFFENTFYGVLVFHYVNNFMTFTRDDIEVAQAFANQTAIVIHQARLYKKMQIQVAREKLLREIISSICGTLDFDDIRQIFVRKLGDALDADLSILYHRDTNNGKFLPVDAHSMHLSSDDIKSPLGTNIIENYGWADYINKNQKPEVGYSDIEDLKKDYNLHGTKAEKFLNEYKVKSMIGIPIIHANTFLGFLVINFVKKHREITEDDINLVKVIANQAGIALYQSKLYIQTQQASQAKSEFIANMSHEIRTPLNVIIGFSELLTTSKIEPDKQVKYLQNINNSGKHLLNLTNDIINIAKIESGKFQLNYESIDTKNLIMDVVNTIKLILNDKDVSIDLMPSKIIADRKILTQILYNLLDNAIKFTPNAGTIKIKSKVENDKLIISIEDTGIGIDAKDINIIFEKFKQVDSSIDRIQSGAGLGLAISKKLVELLNGSIHVESVKDEGSRFWFILPNAEKTD